MMSRLQVWQPSNSQAGDPSPALRTALLRLLQAHRYARDVQCDPWQFAVLLDTFVVSGTTSSDLRWLVAKGYVEHALEMTAPRDSMRHFQPQQNWAFEGRAGFVLSDAGVSFAESLLGQLDAATLTANPPSLDEDAATASQPRWDSAYRALFFGEHVVKRYRVLSPNQEAILMAFEEEGWPRRIDDPLPPYGEVVPKSRLNNTVKCLNRHQKHRLICFMGDGTGEGVCWTPAANAVLAVPLETNRRKLRLAA